MTEETLKKFTEYDYYAIVTPDRIKKDSTQCDHGYNRDCDSLLSFKREYLDHHQEVTTNKYGGKSYNDVVIMKTTDKKIVSQILRIYTLFSSVGLSTGPGSVYSYDFEEKDDQYVLTVNNIGVGYNSEMMNNPEAYSKYTNEEDWLAINLYRRYFIAEKETGEVLEYKGLIDKNGYKTYQNESKTKKVRRHIKEEFNEQMRENRLSKEGKELYKFRKEKVERSFADSKNNHGYRYAMYKGVEKNQNYTWLICAAQNMKNIAIKVSKVDGKSQKNHTFITNIMKNLKKLLKNTIFYFT